MIRVKRTPLNLRNELKVRLNQAKEVLFRFYKLSPKKREQVKQPFDGELFSALLPILIKDFKGKCAYCERALNKDESIVENFRPRNGAKGGDDFSADHYGWLSYEWKNLLLSCNECGRFKSSFFPVKGARVKVGSTYQLTLKEKNLLIDPCNDDPSLHLQFDEQGRVKPLSEKGDVTIKILRLDRDELRKSRKKVIVSETAYLTALFSHAPKSNLFRKGSHLLYSLMSDECSEPHLGVTRELISKSFLRFPDRMDELYKYRPRNYKSIFFTKVYKQVMISVGKREKVEYESDMEYYKRQDKLDIEVDEQAEKIFLKRIEIRNFKGITNLVLDFPQEILPERNSSDEVGTEPWTMLLGENGVGKSTILQAIALALMGRKCLRLLRISSNSIINKEATKGYIRIYHHGSDAPFFVTFSKGYAIKTGHNEPSSTLIGYGASRMAATSQKNDKSKIIGKSHVRNLFNPASSLIDAQSWIINLYKEARRRQDKKKLFNWLAVAIKDLLLLGDKATLTVKGRHVMIQYSPKRMEYLEDFSDGYKSVVTVTIDIIRALLKDKTTIETAQGIVLLDEVGTHLHPRWKMQVVFRLRKVFPKLQFIVTTHDPLCLRGLRKGEIKVFYKTQRNKVRVFTDLPDPTGLNAEQLLSSQYFGLNSTYDWKDEADFNEYHFLLSKKKLNKEQREKMIELRDFVYKNQHVGNSQYDRIFNDVIHKELATSKFVEPKSELSISQEVINKIEKVLR